MDEGKKETIVGHYQLVTWLEYTTVLGFTINDKEA